jgi:hypothetical protein
MADPSPYPDSKGDTGDDIGVGPDREPTTSTPRWVKVSGIIALVLVLLVVILLLAGGGHGPGRHVSSGGLGGHISPASATEHGQQPP